MDRSVLSQAAVVEASRDFVCARLATYENAAEADFLAGVFRGRSGELENTVFTILAPDGETKLTGAGRSPEMVFGRPPRGGPGGRRGPPGGAGEGGPDAGGDPVEKMVATMKEIAERYPSKKSDAGAMPYAEDVRLALNIAACDMLPVAVVVAKEGKERARIESALRDVAWSDDCIGRVVYAATGDRDDLAKIEGVSVDAVLIVVQPDPFGLEGQVLAQTSKSDRAAFEKTLADALAKHDPGEKDAREHIRDGRQKGVDWETAVPVTDPHAPPERGPPR